jgi:CheY-like chemotaxis protein
VAREARPEVAFLDIGLPDISGYDLARRLLEMPECVDTMLIALSGWGQTVDMERSREAGFVRHLVKPVELAAIRDILETVAPAEQT